MWFDSDTTAYNRQKQTLQTGMQGLNVLDLKCYRFLQTRLHQHL